MTLSDISWRSLTDDTKISGVPRVKIPQIRYQVIFPTVAPAKNNYA